MHSGIECLRPARTGQGPSEILRTASAFLAPILLLFGVYIFVHGHLTPGGGFQGGVIIAASVVLGIFGAPDRKLRHGVMTVLESISGIAYVAIAILGIVLVAGFLDPTFLPLGEIGTLVSAGAIPIIYSVVGIKVGTELSGVVDRLRAQEEA
jgi:multicomponent Na+:H+ antiporter subunit B